MVRIALVEDDTRQQEELLQYLHQYERECKETFRITVFSDGMDIVENYNAKYDIILMDIEMVFMDGMTAAEKIRHQDGEVVIIFITNMPQYVMKGYTVDAMDYVLKPVTYFSFSQRIDRALTRMRRRSRKYIMIPIKGGMHKVDISRITYVEVCDHDLILHTRDGIISSKGSLTELEASLLADHFFRCNKCYLVNLEHVDSFQNSDIHIGQETIQVSRARKKAFLDALNNYLSEVGK